MGSIRVINKRYTFFLTAKSIYFKTNDSLNQQFQVISSDGTALSRQCFLELLDSIYRGRIKDTSGLNEHILTQYRLERVNKKL